MKKVLLQTWTLLISFCSEKKRFAKFMGTLIFLVLSIWGGYEIFSDWPSKEDKNKLITVTFPVNVPRGVRIVEIPASLQTEDLAKNHQEDKTWFVSLSGDGVVLKVTLFIIEKGIIFSNSWDERIRMPKDEIVTIATYYLSDKKLEDNTYILRYKYGTGYHILFFPLWEMFSAIFGALTGVLIYIVLFPIGYLWWKIFPKPKTA